MPIAILLRRCALATALLAPLAVTTACEQERAGDAGEEWRAPEGGGQTGETSGAPAGAPQGGG
jgi:hypothetical protein